MLLSIELFCINFIDIIIILLKRFLKVRIFYHIYFWNKKRLVKTLKCLPSYYRVVVI